MAAKNILIVGVGGQGTILIGKLLSSGFMQAGYDVKMSEIHGMSQRGGSVFTMVRYGDKVCCPVIEEGSADLLVAFERLEAMRSLSYLKPEGTALVNDLRIDPAGVLSQQLDYPSNIVEAISHAVSAIIVPATQMAKDLGNERVMNVILLGIIVKHMGLEAIDWNEIIAQNVRASFVDIDIAALNLGLSYIAE
ncbi:MAG: indolepyruvate oxidoreductase subunit beta [Eubacteriaceae bacterium]|nr:indolepyruvate oxidoreductase subunit beta [Eubacteriaceae bacterium]